MFPAINIIENINFVKNFIDKENRKYMKYAPRFVITLIIFVMASIIPKFSTFLNLIGSFSGTAIQFIFPILAYQVFFRDMINKWQTFFNYFCLTAGILGGAFAVYDSVIDLAS